MVHWLDYYLVRNFWEGLELKMRTEPLLLRRELSSVPRLHGAPCQRGRETGRRWPARGEAIEQTEKADNGGKRKRLLGLKEQERQSEGLGGF